jgi:cytoskeleton protein RodZ
VVAGLRHGEELNVDDAQTATIGAELAQARKRQGLSLVEVARRTKINVAMLSAIERSEFEQLPGGIFTRGFLRTYAREVGCDPDAIISRFRETSGEVAPPAVSTDGGEPESIQTRCNPGQLHVADIDEIERRQSWTKWISAIAIVIGAIGIFLLRGDHTRRSLGPNPLDVPPAELTVPGVEVGTAGTSAGSRDAAHTGDPSPAKAVDVLRLNLQPQAECWVSATADHQRVVYRQMNPNEHEQVEAREEVRLRVGDAANCRFTINGASARPLGAVGQPVTIRLTKQNYQEFLER